MLFDILETLCVLGCPKLVQQLLLVSSFVTNPIEPVDILAILASGILKSNLSHIPPNPDQRLSIPSINVTFDYFYYVYLVVFEE